MNRQTKDRITDVVIYTIILSALYVPLFSAVSAHLTARGY